MRRAAVVLAFVLAGAAHAGPVRIPGSALPPSIVALGAIDGVTALALSPDGSLAAAAAADPEGKPASTVRLADAGAVRGEIAVRGIVRSLAFDAHGAELFVLADRRTRRSMGETFLVRVDTTTLKAIREIVLPRDARDVALKDEETLLVASDGELRTFLVPAFTSGPLYRVDGANPAIASVPGTSLVVLGRDEGLWLLDLADAQTRDGLPVRERLRTGGAVADVVVAPDALAGFARLIDGTVLRFRVRPFTIVGPEGNASWIGWLPEEGESPAEPEPAAAPVPEPAAAPTPVPAPAPAIVATPPVVAVEVPKVEAPPPPPAAPPPAPPVARVESPAPPIVPHDARMEGQVRGAAMGAVVAVVVLGPDNILREAARVKPDDNGYWFVKGLPAGTYRVLLDAGGGRVLEASPAFRTVVVGAEGTAGVEPIEAVRIR